jgi:hypothetical protein
LVARYLVLKLPRRETKAHWERNYGSSSPNWLIRIFRIDPKDCGSAKNEVQSEPLLTGHTCMCGANGVPGSELTEIYLRFATPTLILTTGALLMRCGGAGRCCDVYRCGW